MSREVVIIDACRTPIGKIPGSLSNLSDVGLMSYTFKKILERAKIDKNEIESVFVGCCFPQEGYNLARKAALKAEFPDTLPAATINRTCCSSTEALVQGARMILLGEADTVLVGGVESMSNSPDTLKNAFKRIKAMMKGQLPAYSSLNGDLIDEMGLATEKLARKYNITREEQDDYALNSHLKAARAYKANCFKDELIPVVTDNVNLDKDENVIEDITLDMISAEPPMYLCDGLITKFNASSVNDGAAAMILMSQEKASALGLKPIAKYVCSDVSGISPEDMGIGPVKVIKNVLTKQKMSFRDVEAFECNEAFAAQILACQKELNWDPDKVNIHGGSIALGHPVGCSGLRIGVTLINIMQQKNYEFGIASLCAGGGMGQAIMFQAC